MRLIKTLHIARETEKKQNRLQKAYKRDRRKYKI